MATPRITSFLVKVASRCNLDCDYCYVYHHADQGWRSMPRLLSTEDQRTFAARLAEYAREASLTECVVVLHGGEPLLAGSDSLVGFASELRNSLAGLTRVSVGMQTNGVLLSSQILEQLERADISVSLSLDGPKEANDLHRKSRKGRSSFGQAMRGLELLKARPKVFAGVIAVIDPSVSPQTLFEFFDAHRPPKLDFLLPDAHHDRPPPGRSAEPYLYRDWLLEAFDLWFDYYPHLPVRTFEALLDSAAGLPSGTDAFGLGDVSLLTVETDGTYHDLDVLKVVGAGATRLTGSVRDTSIASIARSPQIAAHQRLLRKEGLSGKCQACPVVDVCGGGSLPHRHGAQGFDHPSVYCDELFALISHVRARLKAAMAPADIVGANRLRENFDFSAFELAETAQPDLLFLREDARRNYEVRFVEALRRVEASHPDWRERARALIELPHDKRAGIAAQPGAVAWSHATVRAADGCAIRDVDGEMLQAEPAYIAFLEQSAADDSVALKIGQDDTWLRAPFGRAIVFEPRETAEKAIPLVREALDIVRDWRPLLADEMALACGAIQFIRDPAAHPNKIVSFSDNSVPGALFVSVTQGTALIDPFDLADSLIHEHRHQKLYLLERLAPTVQVGTTLVVSPWREDLRPASGLLHAVFVFVELQRFWLHVREAGAARMRDRAANQVRETERHLAEAIQTLKDCRLTPSGRHLADILEGKYRGELAA